MSRKKANKRKVSQSYQKHVRKEIKEQLPEKFYDNYIDIAMDSETERRIKNVDVFLQDYIGHKIDLYAIEHLFRSIDKYFENHDLLNDDSLYEKMNVFHTTLIKLLPLCESKNNVLREQLIRKLFECLCYILESMTKSYIFLPFIEINYFDVHENIREKINWYNEYIDEYYNLLLRDASDLVKHKVSDNWSIFFDAIAETLNCAQQVLIFCQYYRMIGKKSSINQKTIIFIDNLILTLSSKKNEAIFNAIQLISDYKKLILEVDSTYSSVGSIWYPVFSQLYFDYQKSWKNTTTDKCIDYNIPDIKNIKQSTAIFLEYNKLKPSEKNIINGLSNIDHLNKILNYLDSYAKLTKEDRTRTVISAYSDLCVQVLIFISKNDSYNRTEPPFIHKTFCALFKKIYNKILDDLKNEIEFEKKNTT